MRFKVANYSRLEIRLDTLHIYKVPEHEMALKGYCGNDLKKTVC